MKFNVIFLLVLVFLVSFVSALDFDNAKNYDPEKKRITIINSFGLGDDIATVTLDSDLEVKVAVGYQKVAELTIENYDDYTNALKDMEFYDINQNNKIITRQFDYKVKTSQLVDVDDYGNDCYFKGNHTVCDWVKVGSHKELRDVWVDYVSGDLIKGNLTLGIFTTVRMGDKIEWIPTLFGVEIDEWAIWTQDLEVGLFTYYKLDETSGSVVIDFLGDNDGTNIGPTQGAAGILRTGYSFDGLNDYIESTGFASTTGDYSFQFWLNPVNTAGFQILFDDDGNDGGDRLFLFSAVNDNQTGFFDGTAKSFNVSVIIGSYNHYVFVFNSSSSLATLYINATKQPDEPVYVTQNLGNNITLGVSEQAKVNPYNGLMDEVVFWNRSLTQAEITQLYNAGVGIAPMSIVLDSPADDSTVGNITDINFVCNASSSSLLSNISFILNGVINETFNLTNLSVNDISHNFTRDLPIGTSTWNCNAIDQTSQSVNATQRTITAGLLINSQTFNFNTTEGSTETFTLNYTALENPLSANLIYNGSSSSASIDASNFPIVIVTETIVIPNVNATGNLTFFWNLVSATSNLSTPTASQIVNNIVLDNCSSFSNVLFNFSIVDEATQVVLNGTVDNVSLEVDISLFSADKTIQLINFSTLYNQTNPNAVCSDVNLFNGSDFILDATIKYSSAARAIEYYNIRDSTISNLSVTQNITLFDIKTSESTEFQITFKNSDFVVVEGALIQVNRQYVSEGVFKTVELPITDSNGQTVVHLVQNDIVYNYIVTKDNVIIGTFNNLIAFCDDATIGQCFISLNALSTTPSALNPDAGSGISFTLIEFNETSRNLQFSFSTNDGSVRTVLLNGTKLDQLGNTSVCLTSLTSSSGTLTCNIAESFGNETIVINVFVDGRLALTTFFRAANDIELGVGGFFILLFLVISLALMFGESKSMMVFGIILGFVGGGMMFLLSGGIIAGASAVIWLIIMGLILIWKLNMEGQT